MKRNIGRIIILVTFLQCICFGVYAEDDPIQISYSKGDQNFILNAGMFIPLFYQSLDGSTIYAGTTTHIGITGTLSWMSFINQNTCIGFEFGGSFSQTLNRSFSMIPIMAKIGYLFMFYPFELPVSLSAGVNFLKLDDDFTVSSVLRPEVGFYWNRSSEWAFGLNVSYWLVPEIYFSSLLSAQSRFGNFLDIKVSVLYHF